MRRLLRLVAVCCFATAGLVLVFPTASEAEGPQAVGWWSRQLPFQDDPVEGQSVGPAVRFTTSGSPAQIPPVTTIPLPAQPPELPEAPVTTPDSGEGTPNPGVPDGGLWVANDLTGASAISALRFRGDIGAGELRLTFAPGSTVLGPVVACPTLSDWAPGPAGAWRDRPAHDCDRFELSGRPSLDTTQLIFAIPQGFAEFGSRVVDIIVMPARGTGDTFNLYFEAPDADSFEVFAGQEPPPPETTLPDVPEEQLPTTIPTTRPPFVPPPPTVATTIAEAEETAAPVVEIGGGGVPGPRPIADVLDPLTESRFGRIVAILVLFAMGGGLWFLGSQEARPPRLIGGLAGAPGARAAAAQVARPDIGRGIGRFRRERSAPPQKF